MMPAKFWPRPTGSNIVKLILPGGVVESRRYIILLIAAIASSPVVLPASKRIEPAFGKVRASGTESVAEQGRASRRAFAAESASFSTSTSKRPNFAPFVNSCGGVQFFQFESSHAGNIADASAFTFSKVSHSG